MKIFLKLFSKNYPMKEEKFLDLLSFFNCSPLNNYQNFKQEVFGCLICKNHRGKFLLLKFS
jgi:hypothetical protein